MLTVENLSFAYGTVGILRDINMQMQTGRVTCVIGRNGVGKTTLMKNIIGLLKASEGTVRLDERTLARFLQTNERKLG